MSDMKNCNLLDTRAIQTFLDKQEGFLKRYRELDTDYNTAAEELLENWEGAGADAFRGDVVQMGKNMLSLQDVMEGVTCMLIDAERVFADADNVQSNLNHMVSETET